MEEQTRITENKTVETHCQLRFQTQNLGFFVFNIRSATWKTSTDYWVVFVQTPFSLYSQLCRTLLGLTVEVDT